MESKEMRKDEKEVRKGTRKTRRNEEEEGIKINKEQEGEKEIELNEG